jgi:gas vesicle structural protein
MTATERRPNRYVSGPSSGGLHEVLELILDKGLVIDAYVRVSLVGIELLTIDARIVIASVDTYLRFAEAVGRLNLAETEVQGIPELMDRVTEGGAKHKTKGALEGVKDKVSEALSSDEDEDEDEGEDKDKGEKQPAGRKRQADR